MIKLTDPTKGTLASPKYLASRVKYIADQEHPDHAGKGKIVLPSRNYGCPGQSVDNYLKTNREHYKLGQLKIENHKGGGNPTKNLLLELIYSSPENSHPTPEERDLIEQLIVAEFWGCAIRCAWHINPANGIHECHFLISARDRYGNATLSRYGSGKQTFTSRRNQLDQEICDLLNSTRDVVFEPVHVLHRRNKGLAVNDPLTPLSQLIAQHTTEPVTEKNLLKTIHDLGHQANLTRRGKSIEVTYEGRQLIRRHRIKTILMDIKEAQLDIELGQSGNDGHEGGAGGKSGGGTGGRSAPSATQTSPTKKTATVKTDTARPAPFDTRPPSIPGKKLARKKPKKLTPKPNEPETPQI